DYIDFRLRAAGYKGAPVFSPPALSLLAAAALGLTRRINILADKSLLAAYAAGRNEVSQDEAKAAIEDCDFSVAAPPPGGGRAPYLVVGGIAILCLALIWLWLRPSPPDSRMANPLAAVAVPVEQPAPDPSSAAVLPAPPAATPAEPLPVATPPASLTEQRLAAGRAWLQQAEDEHWFIQLRAMDADQSEQIEAFLLKLEKLLPTEQTRAYLGKRGNTPRIGIIFGEYENHSQASRGHAELPHGGLT